jgi:hypothetical protein
MKVVDQQTGEDLEKRPQAEPAAGMGEQPAAE